jgi:hypothetical protein
MKNTGETKLCYDCGAAKTIHYFNPSEWLRKGQGLCQSCQRKPEHANRPNKLMPKNVGRAGFARSFGRNRKVG